MDKYFKEGAFGLVSLAILQIKLQNEEGALDTLEQLRELIELN